MLLFPAQCIFELWFFLLLDWAGGAREEWRMEEKGGGSGKVEQKEKEKGMRISP